MRKGKLEFKRRLQERFFFIASYHDFIAGDLKPLGFPTRRKSLFVETYKKVPRLLIAEISKHKRMKLILTFL
jgi:hypothetical protein